MSKHGVNIGKLARLNCAKRRQTRVNKGKNE